MWQLSPLIQIQVLEYLKSLSNVVLNFQHGIRAGMIPFWPALAAVRCLPSSPLAAVRRRQIFRWNQGWVHLKERDRPLHIAWSAAHHFWRVKATRRLPAVGTFLDHLQSLRRPVLGTVQPLFFNYDHLERVSLVFPHFSLLGFCFFGQKWLLPALCTQF